MSIQTSTDLYGTLNAIRSVGDNLSDPHKAAFDKAMAFGVPPVQMTDEATEALYAAVKQDATLTGEALIAVATACKQVGFLMTTYSWHGKAQRCADMGAAMEAVVAGTAPADAGGPDIDERFAPPPILTPAPGTEAGH